MTPQGIVRFARGLQAINGMEQSEACLALLEAWAQGTVTLDQASALIEGSYEARRDDPCRGGDLLDLRAVQILADPPLPADADLLLDYLYVLPALHGALFGGLLPNDAFRLRPFQKTDPTGSGAVVTFCAPRRIADALQALFAPMSLQGLRAADGAPDAEAIARLIAGLYAVRPFEKGSLKVAAVYLMLLLGRMGAVQHAGWFGAHSKAYHRSLYMACCDPTRGTPDLSLLTAMVQGALEGETPAAVTEAEAAMGIAG